MVDPSEPEHICADCGAALVPARNGWWKDLKGHLACRAEIDRSDPEMAYVVWADYHYVEGERQRHWYKP